MARRPVPPGATCYACDAPATTWEHAPPRGFYPKRDEVRPPSGEPKRDYRQHLIQVPSCSMHNNEKSGADSYALTFIVVIAASMVGATHPWTREAFVDQHMENLQRGRRIRKAFFANPSPIDTPYGEFVAIRPDTKALHALIQNTARAIFYYESYKKTGSWDTAEKWRGGCNSIDMQLVMEGGRPHPLRERFIEIESAFKEAKRRPNERWLHGGPHPHVFYYQMMHLSDGSTVMRLVFYGVYRMLALPMRNANRPHRMQLTRSQRKLLAIVNLRTKGIEEPTESQIAKDAAALSRPRRSRQNRSARPL
jgi:hypothetical protein